ncbi:SidE phosphodiesterase domain-containing protein [Legionella fallonii]|uniref:SidE PDE domain-containing protein n=1 Tax=Legionella fallonii LLAP-10 TaxID=1212491 RepID=A0A098G396_9GAMM|nr:SidE phosphodiesterase domain-containing protein [Legionella fallonii]CEG56464.1 protein of unknown function [Legionella fallonii LLAP-10]
MPKTSNNFTLLRGLGAPSGTPKDRQKRKKHKTNSGYELHKPLNSPHGNLSRSTSLADHKTPAFSAAGYILSPQLSKFSEISSSDSNSGRGKKEHLHFTARLPAEEAKEQLTQLAEQGPQRITYTYRGYGKFYKQERALEHSETLYDIAQEDITGVYFFPEPNFYNMDTLDTEDAKEDDGKNLYSEDLLLYHASLLQAVYLQQEFEIKSGKSIDIYQYSPKDSSLFVKKKQLTHEELLKLWEEIVEHSLEKLEKKNPLLLATLTVEEIKTISVYGTLSNRLTNKILSVDIYYPDELKNQINSLCQKKLVDRLNRLKNDPAIKKAYEDKYLQFNQLPEVQKERHFIEIMRYKKLFNIPLQEKEFTYLIDRIISVFDKQKIREADNDLLKKILEHQNLRIAALKIIYKLYKNNASDPNIESMLSKHLLSLMQEKSDQVHQIVSVCKLAQKLHRSDEEISSYVNNMWNYTQRDITYESIEDLLSLLKWRTEKITFLDFYINLMKEKEYNNIPEYAVLINQVKQDIVRTNPSFQFNATQIATINRVYQSYLHHLERESGFTYIKMLISLYSHKNKELGPMPSEVLEALFTRGIDLALQHPKLLPWYKDKIIKADPYFPPNIPDLLDKAINTMRVASPEKFTSEDVETHLNTLRQIFQPQKVNVANNITDYGAQALIFADNKFLSKKYTEERAGTYFPILYKQNGNTISGLTSHYDCYNGDEAAVYRSNHGLCHTARTQFLVRMVVDFNLKYAAPDIQNHIMAQLDSQGESFIAKLQIAMAFYVSGRESESGFGTEEYDRYRKQSAQNFKDYVHEKNLIPTLFQNEAELETFASCLEHSYLTDDPEQLIKLSAEQKALKVLMYGAHCADLSRIWTPNKIENNTIFDLMKAVPLKDNQEARHAALLIFNEAAKLCKTMGDSVATVYDESKKICVRPEISYDNSYNTHFPKSDLATFFHYSTNPLECIQLLNKQKTELLKSHATEEQALVDTPSIETDLIQKQNKAKKTKYNKHIVVLEILADFKRKIDTIGMEFPKTKQIAENLLEELNDLSLQQMENNKPLTVEIKDTINNKIQNALPYFANDLSWTDYLINLGKSLINALIFIGSLGTKPGFFSLKKSESELAATDLQEQYNDRVFPELKI